jgi:hypothetical protein
MHEFCMHQSPIEYALPHPTGPKAAEVLEILGLWSIPYSSVLPWCRSQFSYLGLGDRDLLILSFQGVHLLYK